MRRIELTITFWALILASCLANSYQQTVRGIVLDRDTKMPLYGVNIMIVGTDPPQGASTNEDGYFAIEKVNVGRIELRISYLGYETRTVPNISVGMGKEVFLNLEMQESLVNLSEVVINGGTPKGEVNNEMALLSARQVTVEETQRFAGSLDDPSRMVSAFAGVTSDPQGNNDIVIRGNSPKGLLWKLEGVEIPNPNHFSDEGTTGGPINALSSNMLTNSDFFMGAFAPEYGNAISGVFDVRMRRGNNQKSEYTVGLGALGTDISAEGPFKKGYNGSYLVNYRYSSLDMLDKLGVVDFGGVPKYQDLSFKTCLPTHNAGSFTLFGLGGISAMIDTEEEDDGTVTEYSDYTSKMGTVGLKHLLPINQYSTLTTTLSISGNGSHVKGSTLKDSLMTPYVNGHWNKGTLRGTMDYSHKLNARHRFNVGVNYAQFTYDMLEQYYNFDTERWEQGIDLNKNAGLLQTYASWKYRALSKLTLVGGVHYTRFLLNGAQAFEPRLAMNWEVAPRHQLSLGYGKHSMIESIITYYGTVYDQNGMPTTPNVILDLTKSDHYILGYQYRLGKKMNAKVEMYYQNLHSVPVENVDTSYYSLINESDGYVNKALVSQGKGYNYGLDFTLERYFYDHYYFMLTASLYDSKYKAMEGVWRNTRYNGNYAFNFLIGKEITVGKPEKGNILNLNAKFFMNGGQRYIPVDLEKSKAQNESVYDFSRAFNERLDQVYQMNFTATYTINRPKVRHEIFIDVYNVFNNQARITEYYDDHTQQLAYYTQLNMIPNIMYRIHF